MEHGKSDKQKTAEIKSWSDGKLFALDTTNADGTPYNLGTTIRTRASERKTVRTLVAHLQAKGFLVDLGDDRVIEAFDRELEGNTK